MRFSDWLTAQRDRRDDIGRLAVIAYSDKTFPKSQQLSDFLTYYSDVPELRRAVKWAHRSWRKARRRAANSVTA